MKHSVFAIVCTGLIALSGCEDMSREDRLIVGGLAGATVGVVTARALNVDDGWLIVAGLAGAAVGTLVARNSQTNECAYKRRDGYYEVRPCR